MDNLNGDGFDPNAYDEILKQFETAQNLIGGTFDVNNLNPTLQAEYLSNDPPDIQKTLDFVNEWEDNFKVFTENLAKNTEDIRNFIYENEK